MSELVKVGTESEIEEDGRLIVTVRGSSIGIFHVDGDYYGLENVCAHQSGPVCTGKIQTRLDAEYVAPTEFVKESFSEEPVVACPWHGWEYEIRTGEHVGTSDEQLRTYDIVIEDGDLFVSMV